MYINMHNKNQNNKIKLMFVHILTYETLKHSNILLLCTVNPNPGHFDDYLVFFLDFHVPSQVKVYFIQHSLEVNFRRPCSYPHFLLLSNDRFLSQFL